MNSGRHVLAQVLDFVHRETLSRLVSKYSAESKVRHFGVRQQLICMAFAQLTWRNGLRDIEACLNSKPEALYHLGFQEPVAKSTLADANEKRDWRLWEDLAKSLINRARNLYQGESLGLDLDNTAAGFEGTNPRLHLHFRSQIKRHKMVGRTDFRTWSHLHHGQGVYRLGKTFPDCELWGFFCHSAKDNLRFTRYKSQPGDKSTGLRSDQIGKLSILKSKGDFPMHLRRVRFYDVEKKKRLVFLTNNLQITALTVAKLYKKRWEIELFFKWIKGNLEIKHYYGTSANAVKTQIWIAVSLYLIVAIIHKNLKLPGSLRYTLQILSVHPFDKTPLNELLMNISSQNDRERSFNQLEMFNL